MVNIYYPKKKRKSLSLIISTIAVFLALLAILSGITILIWYYVCPIGDVNSMKVWRWVISFLLLFYFIRNQKIKIN